MGLHDLIREHLKENRDSLLRPLGDGRFSIRAGDVADSMGLRNRMPSICSILASEIYQRQAGLTLVDRIVPPSGRGRTATFFFVPRNSSIRSRARPGVPPPPKRPPARTRAVGSPEQHRDIPDADLCLVSCGAAKLPHAALAKDLYISDRFQKTRRLVEREGWPWFILSAKHGLLDPEREIEWYDMTLDTMGAHARRDWARTVMNALERHLAGVRSVVIFAGARYREHLEPALRGRGIEVHIRSLRPGNQLQWLNEQLARSTASKPRMRAVRRTDDHSDTARFYALLAQIEAKVGGRHRLADCDGRMGWPERGVYFFFEPGEHRRLSGGDRVVRVGTHALKAGARSTLWKRLNQHRGRAGTGIGNHRGSVFRGLVGRALARRGDCPLPPTWKRGIDDPRNRSGTTSTVARQFGMTRAQVNAGEADLERRVTAHIGRMPFLWLSVPDAPGSESARGRVERGAIGLLSHYSAPAEDPSSAHWLGHHSDRERIRESGLWNSRHVDEPYDPAFLDEMERLIAAWL